MNEQLQQALANVIEKATTGAEAATEFLVEQTPDVVYQLLLWHGIKSGIYFVVGLALLYVGYKVWYKDDGLKTGRKAKQARENKEDWTSFDGCSSITSATYGLAVNLPEKPLSKVLGCVIGFVGVKMLNLVWLQIAVAPKLFLIEYAATLVK